MGRSNDCSGLSLWIWRHWAYWHLDRAVVSLLCRRFTTLMETTLHGWRAVASTALRHGQLALSRRFTWALRYDFKNDPRHALPLHAAAVRKRAMGAWKCFTCRGRHFRIN